MFEDCRLGSYERDPRVVQVTNTCYRAGEAGQVLYLGIGIGYPYPDNDNSVRAGWWLAVTDTAVFGEYERLPEALAALLGEPQLVPVELAAQTWPDDPARAAQLLGSRSRRTRWLDLPPIDGPLLVLVVVCALAALVMLLTAGSTGVGPAAARLAAAGAVGLSWLPVYRQGRSRKPTL